jgi:DNA-binding MurR/RpiR family transcriptional regulator
VTPSLSDRIVAQFASLPPSQQAAARFILDRPHDVALLSMREQARRAGVPPATMTRLAQRLGLKGYDDVRRTYVAAMRKVATGYGEKASDLASQLRIGGAEVLIADTAAALSRHVAALASPKTAAQIAGAAEVIGRSRRIFCLGLRSSFPVAFLFHYICSIAGRQVVLLDAPGGIGLDVLADSGRGDALLVASVRPYTRESVETAAKAGRRGLSVVAITDSRVSPLAEIADRTIVVGTASPSFFDAKTAALAAAEILAMLVAARGGEQALAAMASRERYLDGRRLLAASAEGIMTRILHRQIHHDFPIAARSEGVTITDTSGREYIDASGGAAVSCLGHGHPDVLRAIRAQLDTVAYVHTSFFSSAAAEELADTLIADAPEGISHAYFVSGGSEAIEASLKMARQYFVERGEPQRRHVIARPRAITAIRWALWQRVATWRGGPFSIRSSPAHIT